MPRTINPTMRFPPAVRWQRATLTTLPALAGRVQIPAQATSAQEVRCGGRPSAERCDELVELVHRLAHAVLHARRESALARFPGRVHLVGHEARLALVLVE